MPRYKLIIFDFDGTLGDTFEWFTKSINSAARLFRFREITLEDGPILRDMGTRDILRYLGVALWKLPFIATYMRLRMRRELASMKPFPGVEALIHALHAEGISLILVSSNSEFNVRGIMSSNAIGLIDQFYCGSSILGKGKKFFRVAKEFDLQAKDILCIGDEPRDIEAAREAGMDSGAVTWGYAGSRILSTSKPTYVFEQMEDILKVL